MTKIVTAGVAQRDAQLKARLGVLAYEHYQLAVRSKEIEVEIEQLRCAQGMNDLVRKDIDTETAVATATQESKE